MHIPTSGGNKVFLSRGKAVENLCKRFIRPLPDDERYLNRLVEELDIIEDKGFIRCFEQVTDIIEYTRGSKIPHVLRGSGACSLMCYLLGITSIDPVKEDMALARFMNSNREDQPDIDIDVPHWVRPQIFQYLTDRYPNAVARISNDVKYSEKTALRKVLKEHGVKGRIPRRFKVEDYFEDEAHIKQIKSEAGELIGKHKHWSLHCGGLIVYEDGIPEDIVLKEYLDGGTQINLTKYDVEEKNLIKIDLLGSRGLSQLWEIDDRPLDEYPYEDKKISEMLCRGEVLGLTQAESRTIRKALIAIQPKNYHDVALALALIRPAAADGGRKASYLRSLGEEEKVKMLIYDDDALGFIAESIGCSMDEADKYRRAFKKSNSKLINEFYTRLTTAKKEELRTLQLNELNKYSFCKGHSLAYGQMVWALAYHKVYNNKKFWEATVKHCNSSYRKWVHKHEAQKAGVFIPTKKHYLTNTEQFLDKGWWSGKDFMPNCFLIKDDNEKNLWYFRGLIATTKRLRRFGTTVRLVTIGTGSGKYTDLVIKGNVWNGNYTIIEGMGSMKWADGTNYIEVSKMAPTWFEEETNPFWSFNK